MTFFAESQIQPHNSIGNDLAPVFSSTSERGIGLTVGPHGALLLRSLLPANSQISVLIDPFPIRQTFEVRKFFAQLERASLI